VAFTGLVLILNEMVLVLEEKRWDTGASIAITSTAALSTSKNLRPKKSQNYGMQRTGGE
jgi:hypothetical protein